MVSSFDGGRGIGSAHGVDVMSRGMWQAMRKNPEPVNWGIEMSDKVITCPNHPFSGEYFMTAPGTVHYGKMVCPTCERFLRWVAKPDSEKRNRRESQKLARVFEAAGVGYCQMYLRCKDELPPHVTLVIHHVIEAQDEGPNDPANIWRLCTICHEMVHLMRRNRANPKERPTVMPVLNGAS